MLEDSFDITTNLEGMDQPPDDPERQAVPNDIRYSRSTVQRLKSMGVVPEPVGAA
jgi:hypothetical protein